MPGMSRVLASAGDTCRPGLLLRRRRVLEDSGLVLWLVELQEDADHLVGLVTQPLGLQPRVPAVQKNDGSYSIDKLPVQLSKGFWRGALLGASSWSWNSSHEVANASCQVAGIDGCGCDQYVLPAIASLTNLE